MKVAKIIVMSFLTLTLFSCDKNEKFYFDEPFKDHNTFLGLGKNVKSVLYEKQIFEITEGGYFPNDQEINDIALLNKYPFKSNYLKYMANLNISMIFNHPITGNQYLINEIQVNERISSNNVEIELLNGKIIKYSNEDEQTGKFSISCNYDKDGRIIKLVINSKYPKSVEFKYKGNLIEQITEDTMNKIETINYSIEETADDVISIKIKDKIIQVYLNRENDNALLSKIVYQNENQTFDFENNQLIRNTTAKNDGSYKEFYALEYDRNQVKRILNSNPYSKNNIVFGLGNNVLINSINLETDKVRMKNIGLTFEYSKNKQNDWTEMSYFMPRRYYDEAISNIRYVEHRLRDLGYLEGQISFHHDFYQATVNAELTKSYCSKTSITRKLKYH